SIEEFFTDENLLFVGTGYRRTNDVRLPTASGTYNLIFQANSREYLYEPNFSNNVAFASAPVHLSYTLVPPDLVAGPLEVSQTNISFVANQPSQSATVTVSWVVTNIGPGAATNDWYDAVFVSTTGV